MDVKKRSCLSSSSFTLSNRSINNEANFAGSFSAKLQSGLTTWVRYQEKNTETETAHTFVAPALVNSKNEWSIFAYNAMHIYACWM